MNNVLNIVYDRDNSFVKIQFPNFLDLKINEIEFAQITALYLIESVSIMELCRCYQEQFASIA